jgi:hypothetical protein
MPMRLGLLGECFERDRWSGKRQTQQHAGSNCQRHSQSEPRTLGLLPRRRPLRLPQLHLRIIAQHVIEERIDLGMRPLPLHDAKAAVTG